MLRYVIYVASIVAFFLLTLVNSFAQDDSSCKISSEIIVGGYIKILDVNDITPYSGNPYIGELDEQDISWLPTVGEVLLVAEGPVCLNGENLWRLQPKFVLIEESNYLGENYWLQEALGNDIKFVHTPKPEENILEVDLTREVAVPIIAPNLQVDYYGGGAGGPQTYPCLDLLTQWQTRIFTGRVASSQSGIIQYESACVPVLFEIKPDTTVRLIHDQYIFSESVIEKPVEVIHIPDLKTLPFGIWIVEFESDDDVKQIAYELAVGDEFTSACDNFYPIVTLRADRDINLELSLLADLKLDISAYENFLTDEFGQFGNIIGGANVVESWEFDVEADHRLLGYMGFPITENSHFVRTSQQEISNDGNQTYFIRVDDDNALLTTTGIGIPVPELFLSDYPIYPLPCDAIPRSRQEAVQSPIVLDRLISGLLDKNNGNSAYITFEGEAGDAISIYGSSLDGKFDPILRLYNPSGEFVAESDDANLAQLNPLDAYIPDFEITQNGLYIVEISKLSVEGGAFTLFITRQDSSQLFEDEIVSQIVDMDEASPSSGMLSAEQAIVNIPGDLALHSYSSFDSPVIEYLQDGTIVDIIAGPRNEGGYSWWQIRSTRSGAEGWWSVSRESTFTLIPIRSLEVGVMAEVKVLDDGLSLRAQAGVNQNLISLIPDGSIVTIIDGPVEADGFIWWNVELLDETTGWSVERANNQATLVPQFN